MEIKSIYRAKARSIEALRKEINEGLRIIGIANATFIDTSRRDEEVEVNENADIFSAFADVYSYAFDGKTFTNRLLTDEFGDACVFTLMSRPPIEFFEGTGPVLCEQVLATAMVRYKLDMFRGLDSVDFQYFTGVFPDADQEAFSLFELSLLARMTEKSVRNATHSTKTDRLLTFKIGGGTYVKPKDALAWLKQRRGFVDTDISVEKE